MGYVLDDKVWVGFGVHLSPYERMRDLWSYNPATDSWREEENWPGVLLDEHGNYSSSPLCLSVFSDGSFGYAVKGNVNQLWRYSTSSLVFQ